MELFNFLLYEPEPSILKDLDPMYSYIENIEPIYNPDISHLKVFDTNLKRYLVLLRGLCRSHGFVKEDIHHDRYVICADRGADLMPWEYIYHLDNNLANDDIENLKVINTTPIDIEVKYPYDAKRYKGKKRWNKTSKNYIVYLSLKEEYSHDESLTKVIIRPINIYIVETEIKCRFLKDDEKVIYIDGNRTNYEIDNLEIININVKDIEVKYPYDPVRYYGRKHWDKIQKRYIVNLYLKKEYRPKGMSRNEKQINLYMHKYIAETELENRFLDKNEKVIFIDGDVSNCSIDNLKIVRSDEEEYSKLPRGKVPFQDYRIGGTIRRDNRNISIILYPIDNSYTYKSIIRAKYRYCLKLGRMLKDNERLVYKDNNFLNDDINNLTHKVFERAEYPFENYYIGTIYKDKQDGRWQIGLNHESNHKKNKSMSYAKYKMQVMLGRLLIKGEEVDHIDGNPWNDSDDNLQVLTVEEHKVKTKEGHSEITPKVATLCDGCNTEFTEYIAAMKGKVNNIGNTTNNFFCNLKCRMNYTKNGNIIKNKKLIKYKCTSTGKEFYLPENTRLLPSKFNPDALPFYNYMAAYSSIRKEIS